MILDGVDGAPRPARGTGRLRNVRGEPRYVRVDGVPHHVRVDGAGPLCVLSPGLGMSWFDWDRVVPLLAPRRTVVRFDRPGLGLSGPAPTWPTLRAEARRIGQILDALGLQGPATVVGHSLAGFHAEAFARLFPERTAGVVLVDSSVEEDPRLRGSRPARHGATRAVATLLGAVGVPSALLPRLRRAVVRASRTGGGDPAPYTLVRGVYSTRRALHAILAENATYLDEALELAALRREVPLPGVPVIVLAAGVPAWLDRQRALAALLGGTFRVAEPSGHLVMLDRPKDIADAVLELRTA
ncbi:alpha/beta fold hydrolase [Streptomyces hygroscopicus]|uniref:alpha/beta fold hydrolase n=1 Tax=Streptomyces hygroscopicus TaxID=1912 RepID=UPI0022406240|nr:alpha/beta hydrolase [Streptomyces hygroscopicus]